MILKRKAYQKLLNWKQESKGTSVLLLSGARQAGKSFLCEHFGKNEYKSMIIVNFENASRELLSIFEHGSTDLDMFFSELSTFYNTGLFKWESLIVFDEAHLFPSVRQFLKYLVADGRYDYIETGSFLSGKQATQSNVCPSEEDVLEIFPLDFEEFLRALGDETTVPYLRICFEKRKPLGGALHRKVMDDFRQYLLVGGMPQAVLEYIKQKDFAATDRVKKRILSLYRDDISKYAGEHSDKVTALFEGVPGQLAKKEKKFRLSSIDKDARLRDYEDPIMWLGDSMITNHSSNAADPDFGLAARGDHSSQKTYMADTGLLVSHAFKECDYMDNELYDAILLDDLGVSEGMLLENAVAQMLRHNGHRLFFYSRADNNNRQNMIEIDFLIALGEKICPIEVKLSSYRAHSSLDKFRRKFSSKLGEAYILYNKDVMVKDGVVHLPIYMSMFL